MTRMKRTREVFVAIRHTHSGVDQRLGVFDARGEAMYRAEMASEQAARDFGVGSASVFKATLVLRGQPLRDRRTR